MRAQIGLYVPAATDPDIATVEDWLHRRLDYQHVFTNWDPSASSIHTFFWNTLTPIAAAGRTPLVTWEPFTPTREETPVDIVNRIADGEFDAYLNRWANVLAEWLEGGTTNQDRLLLRLAHEMNGTWYPWGVGAGDISPEQYASMWRHVYDILEFAGVPDARVEWVWGVNHADVGDVRAEDCFPGDAFVDWVAIDGYNWGAAADWSTWQSPSAIFQDMVSRLRRLTEKPICITEFGSTTETKDGRSSERKSAWLEAAFRYFGTADLGMVVGFNVDKETDWAVIGGSAGVETVSVRGRTYNAYPTFSQGMNRFARDTLDS